MKQPTIKHSSIKNNPLIDIITIKDKKYGVSYDGDSRKETLLESCNIIHNVKFSLETIIKNYIAYYGLSQAVKILIGKGVINSNNRSILVI